MGQYRHRVIIEFNIPDLTKKQVDPLIKQISAKIQTDAKQNIRQQKQPDGSPMRPLAQSTRLKKIKKGTPANKALIDTSLMINSIKIFREGVAKYSVGLLAKGNPRRDLVALIHHIDGVNQITRVVRQFLGVSRQREKWIQRRVERFAREILRKTKKSGKTVRT